jgi:hypothetical protein
MPLLVLMAEPANEGNTLGQRLVTVTAQHGRTLLCPIPHPDDLPS